MKKSYILLSLINILCSSPLWAQKDLAMSKTIPIVNIEAAFQNTKILGTVYINDLPIQTLDLGKEKSSNGTPIAHFLKKGKNDLRVVLKSSEKDSEAGALSIKIIFGKMGEFADTGQEKAQLSWKASKTVKFPVIIEKTFESEALSSPKSWEDAQSLSGDTWKSEAKAFIKKIHKMIKESKYEEVISFFTPYFELEASLNPTNTVEKQKKRMFASFSQEPKMILNEFIEENFAPELVGNGKLVFLRMKDGKSPILFSPPPGAYPMDWEIAMSIMYKNGTWSVAL